MHDTELEEILSSYKIQKPTRLNLFDLVDDYKAVRGNTQIKGGDLLLDLDGVDEDTVELMFNPNRRTKKNLLAYGAVLLNLKKLDEESAEFILNRIKSSKKRLLDRKEAKEVSGDVFGVMIPVEYEKDKLLSYILGKGQEAAEGLKGTDRVRSIGDRAYDILTSYVLRGDAKPERDGFIYSLEYFFRRGAIECFKISTIITLVLSMDEELRKEGIKFRLGLRDLYIYDKIYSGVKKDAGEYNSHAWVNVYLMDKSIYIFDKIYGVFADVTSAKKGVSSLEHPEKIFVYRFNPREGIALRRIKRN